MQIIGYRGISSEYLINHPLQNDNRILRVASCYLVDLVVAEGPRHHLGNKPYFLCIPNCFGLQKGSISFLEDDIARNDSAGNRDLLGNKYASIFHDSTS